MSEFGVNCEGSFLPYTNFNSETRLSNLDGDVLVTVVRKLVAASASRAVSSAKVTMVSCSNITSVQQVQNWSQYTPQLHSSFLF